MIADSGRTLTRPSLSFLGVLTLLLERRKFILTNVVIVTVCSILISFLLPKWYQSTATLLPPKQPDLFGTMSAVSSVLKSIPGAVKFGGQRNSGYNYFAILKSRTSMETIVRKFDLIRVYDVPDSSMELAIKELEGNVSFEESGDEDISIQVYDKDSQRAADIANAFVEVLNHVSIDIGTKEARFNREFIEQRLNEARLKLKLAEDSLRAYQEEAGMIITPDQREGMDAIGQLYALKAEKEIQLALLRQQTTSSNPALLQLSAEVAELTRRVSTIPQAGMMSLRLYRDLVIQQKILEFLVPLYEQSRIDEQKNIPVILVLDKAVAAEKKSRPKRVLIVLTGFILGLLTSAGIVLFKNYASRELAGESEDLRRLLNVWGEAKRDLSFVLSRLKRKSTL